MATASESRLWGEKLNLIRRLRTIASLTSHPLDLGARKTLLQTKPTWATSFCSRVARQAATEYMAPHLRQRHLKQKTDRRFRSPILSLKSYCLKRRWSQCSKAASKASKTSA